MSISDCNRCRLEAAKTLVLKTATVRLGLKPAELLRVRKYYCEGADCFVFKDACAFIGLPWIELSSSESSSLVLFYNESALFSRLRHPVVAALLRRLGYPANPRKALNELANRAKQTPIPHAVGLFLGYPVKDVAGFIFGGIPFSCRRSPWRIFGRPQESLNLVNCWGRAEEFARRIYLKARDLNHYLNEESTYRYLTHALKPKCANAL